MKTYLPDPEAIKRDEKWYVIDADGQTLGRLATLAAMVLRGKNKASFAPHLITGDNVIVVNAAKLKVTGNKLEDKIYYRHTEFPGGIKSISLRHMLEKRPGDAIEIAVKGMLPKNHTGRVLMTRLRVYPGAEHPHTAQRPEKLEVRPSRRLRAAAAKAK